MVFCSFNHSIFLFGLCCFLLFIAHQVGPSPSFSSQIDWLHLWPALISSRDLPFFLFPWWEKDCISQFHLGCLHFHHKRHAISCFAQTNVCPFITLLSIFLLMGLHCVIDGWHSHLGRHGHWWPHLNKFGFMCCFISWRGCDGGNSNWWN
jgi:hypothetical protein